MALQIQESLGQAHVPLARVEAYYRWNRDAALREFRRALELNPNDETAHHLYGEYLIRIGLTSEGMRELSAALKLSPAAIANNQDLGTAYYALRQYRPGDRAIPQDAADGSEFRSLPRFPRPGLCREGDARPSNRRGRKGDRPGWRATYSAGHAWPYVGFRRATG